MCCPVVGHKETSFLKMVLTGHMETSFLKMVLRISEDSAKRNLGDSKQANKEGPGRNRAPGCTCPFELSKLSDCFFVGAVSDHRTFHMII